MMTGALPQPLILPSFPPYGLSATFRTGPEFVRDRSVGLLTSGIDPAECVVGLGDPLVRELSGSLPGLRTFPAFSGAACPIPSTQGSLWIMVTGKDRTEVVDRFHSLTALLKTDFLLEDALDTFLYRDGRDLTGYEDGTENPRGDKALKVAIVGPGEPLAGSSFVAVQRWVHDLSRFNAFPKSRQDEIMGRERVTNEELPEAPASAHVRRSAQESYDPEAFILRRSMPWSRGEENGLEFIAFGRSLDPFERILRRMTGEDDGVVDALFTFSRPVRGGYYWCPPVKDGRLDLLSGIP